MSWADLWWWFWVATFYVAGTSFAVIAVIVLARGVADLRAMIRILEGKK